MTNVIIPLEEYIDLIRGTANQNGVHIGFCVAFLIIGYFFLMYLMWRNSQYKDYLLRTKQWQKYYDYKHKKRQGGRP